MCGQRSLSRIDPKEIEEIHAQTVDIIKRKIRFREGTIGGYVVAGIDGVKLFSSTKILSRMPEQEEWGW